MNRSDTMSYKEKGNLVISTRVEQKEGLVSRTASLNDDKDKVIQELLSSTKREWKNIIKVLGSEIIIPMITQEEQIFRLIQSMDEINLSKMDNSHRFYGCLMHELKREYHCRERITTLQFLFHLSKFHGNKGLIASYPGILDSLHVVNAIELEISCITEIVLELAKAMDSKPILSQNTHILDFLILNMKRKDKESRDIQMMSIQALMHLSEANENIVCLVNYNKKSMLQTIMNVVEEKKSTMADNNVSIVALVLIGNLICKRTTRAILEHPNLLSRLLNIIIIDCSCNLLSQKAAQVFQKLCFCVEDESLQQDETLINFSASMFIKSSHDGNIITIGMVCILKCMMQCNNIPLIFEDAVFVRQLSVSQVLRFFIAF